MRPNRLLIVALFMTLCATSRGEDEKVRRAREEVDKEMQEQMAAIPPPMVEVIYAGVDKPSFELEAATFTLDDETLGTGEVSEMTRSGPKTLYSGEVAAGKHLLTTNLVFRRTDVSIFSGLRIFKFKIDSEVPLLAQRGLKLHVHMSVHVMDSEPDPKKQLQFTAKVKPEMTAQVDDSPMPELAEAQPAPPPPVVHVEAPPPAPQGSTGGETAKTPQVAAEKVTKHQHPGKLAFAVEKLRTKLAHEPPPRAMAQNAPAPSAVSLDAGVALAVFDAGAPAAAATLDRVDAGVLLVATVAPPEPSTSRVGWILAGLALFAVGGLGVAARQRANRFKQHID